MKDIIIRASRLKKEIITLCCCFVLANILNIYAIFSYDDSSTVELLTSLGYVVVMSVAIYIVWSITRLLYRFVKRLFTKNK